MKLEHRCAAGFLAGDRRRGLDYFRAGRVDVDLILDDGVDALVGGSSGAYEVQVLWPHTRAGILTVSCTCPRFAGGYACKHLWATLLACDRRSLGQDLPGPEKLKLEMVVPDPFFDAEEDPLEAVAWPPPETGTLPPMPPSLRSLLTPEPWVQTPADWQMRFATVRYLSQESAAGAPWLGPASVQRRRAWFRLNLWRSRANDALTIDFYQQKVKLDGDWGKIKGLQLTPQSIPSFLAAEDREILGLLYATHRLSDGSGYPSSYSYGRDSATVPAVLYEAVLPQLCSTGRFGWAENGAAQPITETLTWDGGEAWKLGLSVERDAGEPWVLSGFLERGDERRTLDEPILLLTGGLVVFPECVARLDAGEHFPWISVLRENGEIQVPESDLDAMLEELWKLPALPVLQMPEEISWDERQGTPTAGLRIAEPSYPRRPRRLEATVLFDYGRQTVMASESGTAVFDRETRSVLLRDHDAERAAFVRLSELGFEPPAGYDRYFHDYDLKPKLLPGVIGALLEEGWKVELDEGRLRPAGDFELQVRSGIDWFGLEGDLEFDDVPVALPELLRALRKGEDLIELSDGSRGVLSEDLRRRLEPLAHLAQGDRDGEVRFLPSQAFLLDALLQAMPKVDVDRRFTRARDRLRSFEGVGAASEPRGFQGELRAYQREGLGWVRFLQEFGFGGCLADDMGLGKTVQVLAALQGRRLRPENKRRPSLVVAPRSVLSNWIAEAARFAPRLRTLSYHGPERHGLIERFAEHDLVVTTYATLRLDVARLTDVTFDYAILDEAQAIKNASSQAAKACRLVRAEHRLALTGTPVENHLGELWSLFEFLNPGMLGRLPRLKGKAGRRMLGGDSLHTVANALRPFILRRTKEQVLDDLPEKTEQTLECELSRKERKRYDELRDHYRALLDRRISSVGLKRSKIQVLEALLRLRQAACHPGLLDPQRAGERSAKLDVALEQLDEILSEGHKALVFSQFTRLLAILRRQLDARKVTYEYLDGRTRKRQAKVDRFQTDPDCRLFLISLKAGGLGLNLTAADYVYILDPWWNPAVEAQAVDRVHRIGQTRPVFAYRLISRDTVEEKILELQASKRELAKAILTADQSLIRNLSAEDLRLLLS